MSSIFQTLSGVIDRGMPLAEAVSAPRVHALLNRKVWIEKPALSARLNSALAHDFTHILVRTRHHYWMGSVQGIQFLEDGSLHAAADPRREGYGAVVELSATQRQRG